MDIKNKEARSYNMSRIKGKNTKPEILARSYLYERNIRYRCHVAELPGKPDIAIKKYKTAVIVNGCFWHGHTDCTDFRLPKSNVSFWDQKITGNIKRDLVNESKLGNLGFSIFKIWECEIKSGDFTVLDHAIDHINTLKNHHKTNN
ncbi:very short patch repair endonuclease [Dehalococcoidia bacterium]|nr:very short patch repair endonuclease [Dehalococcoidia bacterium]